jgi:argininosuccinate lyase
MLEVCTEFAQNISFNSERIQSSLPAGHLDATTLADYLVKKVNLLLSTTIEWIVV